MEEFKGIEGEKINISHPYTNEFGIVVSDVHDKAKLLLGRLIFHEMGDWQASVVKVPSTPQGNFDEALKLARENFPSPPCDYLNTKAIEIRDKHIGETIEGENIKISKPYTKSTGVVVIDVYDKMNSIIGSLIFHEQRDWQFNQMPSSRDADEALKLARENFPSPPCDYLKT